MSMMGQMMNGYTVVAGSDVGQAGSTMTTTTTTKKGKAKAKKTTKKVASRVVAQPMEAHSGEVVTTSEGGTTQIMTTQVQDGGRTVVTKKTTKTTQQRGPQMSQVTQRTDQVPREYDTAEYFKVGQDYSQFRGTTNPRGPVNQYGIPLGTPINKILVEKIAAPKVARCMRELFETGNVPDLLKRPEKIQIIRDDAKEAGVYENQPTLREGVVRETDEVTTGEVLEEGTTKNIVTAWKDITTYKGCLPKMSTIKIDTSNSGPAELESQPTRLDNVVREADALDEVVVPEDGYTGKLRYKFLYPEEKKLERGPIKLVEREGERAVFENEPTAPREGVIRSDYEEEQMSYEPGYIRNVAGFFAGVSDDKPKASAPIVIDRSNVMILESQPTIREGVVRESDVQDVDAQLDIEQGRTRNLAGRWQNMKDDGPRKGPFKMDLAPEAGVLENEPVILDNVIRCDAVTEDVMLPGAPGGIKSIATRFTSPSGGHDGPRKGMIDIDMAPESGVVENTPAERDPTIVKCDDYTEDQCEVKIQQGTATGLHQRWRAHEEDHMKIRTAMDYQESVDKPTWIREMESKGNGGVYENEPGFREDVIREADITHDENQEQIIPSNYSRSMKNMWLTREGEMEKEVQESRRYIPEPIRFTPPRDVSPPPLNQETTQSFQSITLGDTQNEFDDMDTSTTIDLSAPAPPAPTEKKAQRTERKKIAPHTAPKSSSMKSSATFTLS